MTSEIHRSPMADIKGKGQKGETIQHSISLTVNGIEKEHHPSSGIEKKGTTAKKKDVTRCLIIAVGPCVLCWSDGTKQL